MRRMWMILLVIVVAALLTITVLLSNIGRENGIIVSSAYNPYDREGSWYKGQLHCHSNRRDGSLSPEGVVSRYASLGFDFMALTDHNMITRVNGSGILVLGQEDGGGSTESGVTPHMCGYNISYVPPKYASVQDRIDNMTAQGGIVSLNHPTDPGFSYSTKALESLTNYTCLEIYNGKRDATDIAQWDDVLCHGKKVWGIASDDEHIPTQFGKAWVEVRMIGGLSTDNITNAIRHGSFYATQGPIIDNISFNGNFFNVSCPGADSITFYGQDGILLRTIAGSEASFHVDGSENYIRIEISHNGLKAWSQPVFLGPKVVPSASSMKNSEVAMKDAPSRIVE